MDRQNGRKHGLNTHREGIYMHINLLRHKPLFIVICTTLLLIIVAAGALTSVRSAQAAAHSVNTLGTGRSTGVKVFVEPAAGETPILNAINNATSSIDLEIYLITDQNIISALENAAENGITVRVLLEPHPDGTVSPTPASTLAALANAGAQTEDSSPAFALTHEKGMVIDDATAYIMTCNFSKSALGGSSSTTNREYGIIDTTKTDVTGVLNIFNADWNRSAYNSVSDSDLVVSPINARSDFTALINQASSSLIIEAEEMEDSGVEQAIVNAAARGVTVQVILPSDDSSNNAGITTIEDGGASVKEDAHYYMHAKIIVVDGKEAFVGSENISTYSLDKNRELGILIQNASILSTLQSTFNTDWSASKAA
jgi:cardiolipin synthase A/B